MASTHKHLRSSTAHKRPTTAIAEGQIALATNIASPGLFFKDSTGATIIKVGPVHVGATAPNVAPAGSAGNSTGEIWLDTSLTPVGVKIYDGSSFVNATPIGSTTVQGLLELATNAETQAGADSARAITSAGLQSKLSDSISITSSTTIASATAVKSAYDLANAALPQTGGTITGNLEIGITGSLSFEGATADAFETTIAVVDPTADRTITLPDTTGTIITTGDTGTITSTMLLDGTILNADINASAGIVDTKLATISTAGKVSNSATTATNANTASAIVARDASGNFSAGTITATLNGNASTVTTNANLTGDVTSTGNATSIAPGVIVDADVNASAAIAGTKVNPSFGSQNITTTGTNTAASFIPTSSTVPTNGVYLPAANSVAISTNGTGRLTIDSSGNINIDSGTAYVDAVNNRLGIGTTNPQLSLDIFGTNPGIRIKGDANSYYPQFSIEGGHGALFATTYFGPMLTATNDSGNAPIIFRSGGTTSGGWNSGSERARIDNTGRLLVGTSSARSNLFSGSTAPRLQVEGTSFSETTFSIVRNENISSSVPGIVLGKTRGSSNGANTAVQSGDNLGLIDFHGADGTNLVAAARISADVDGTPGANDMPGRLVFSTTADGASSPTERMRIGSNGNIDIGAVGFSAKINVYSSTNALIQYVENARNTSGDNVANFIIGSNANNTSSTFLQCITAGIGPRFVIYGNGTYGSVSDINLKKNIETTRDGYLDDIQKLRVVKYNWKVDDDSVPKELGLIAQELAEVFPGLVQDSQPDSDNNTVKEVKTSVLPFILLKALQETAEQIKELQAKVAVLEAS